MLRVSGHGEADSPGERGTGRGWRNWRAGERAGVVGAAAAVIGLPVAVVSMVAAVLALRPGPVAPASPPTAASTVTSTAATVDASSNPASASTTSVTGPPRTPLVSLSPQAGSLNLVAVPRTLANRPGYEQAIAIGCPTNQHDDLVREVTYLLRGRFQGLDARMRPWFDPDDDYRTSLVAIVGVARRDGTLATSARGRYGATMNRTAQVAVDVTSAQELTLQVQCDDPRGMVILAGAALTAPD